MIIILCLLSDLPDVENADEEHDDSSDSEVDVSEDAPTIMGIYTLFCRLFQLDHAYTSLKH